MAEDQGQDLISLTVDANTGVITDAGLLSHIFANGDCVVNLEMLYDNRMVHYVRGDEPEVWFKYPMIKLSLNDEVLCDVNGVS